ncbi:MAG TPA: hypothetical protein VF624_10230 [Tepidisphaeraceae bacterium]|jgi:hypothetical protein
MGRFRASLSRINAVVHPVVARAFRRVTPGKTTGCVLSALMVGYVLSCKRTRALLVFAGEYRSGENKPQRRARMRAIAGGMKRATRFRRRTS